MKRISATYESKDGTLYCIAHGKLVFIGEAYFIVSRRKPFKKEQSSATKSLEKISRDFYFNVGRYGWKQVADCLLPLTE